MRNCQAPFRAMLLGIYLLVLVSAPSEYIPMHAAAGCGACRMYLPIVVRPLPFPRLDAPANGAQITSLAPLLSWTPAITGTYRIQVSNDPTFLSLPTIEISATAQVVDSQMQIYVMGSNLSLGATTYYWRVGVLFHGSYLFSPTWAFTTPASSIPLPPAPALVAPPDHMVLPAPEATLIWQSVPGAWYYRVRVYAPGPTAFQSTIVPATTLSYHVSGLASGVTYTWRVKTLDQDGWSKYETVWSFTAP